MHGDTISKTYSSIIMVIDNDIVYMSRLHGSLDIGCKSCRQLNNLVLFENFTISKLIYFKISFKISPNFSFQISVSKFQFPNFSFQISVSKFQFPNFSFQISVSKFQFPNFSFQISVSEFQFPNFSFQISVSKFQFPNFSFQISVSKFQFQNFSLKISA